MKSFAFIAGAGLAAAETFKITLGPSLVFSPNTTKAAVGDVLEFHFKSVNHSVVQSDFNNPCVPLKTAGFFSGYKPASGDQENSAVFRVTVNDTKPIWYYCSQGQHCKSGMVGVVNPPSEGPNNLEAYKKKAAAFNGKAGDAAAAFGGVTAPNGGNASTTTSSRTSSATTSGTPSSTASDTPSGATTSASSTSGTATSTPTPTGNAASSDHLATGSLVIALGAAFYGLL